MDPACFISAMLFFVSAAMSLAEMRQWANRREGEESFRMWQRFDPDTIKGDWEWRRENQPLWMVASIFNAMAWLAFAVPMVQAAWLSSRGGKSMATLHIFVVVLAIAGAICELVSRALTMGGLGTMNWMSQEFLMFSWISSDSNDQLGWQTMELLHTVIRAMTLWIDALEFLFLSGIFLCFFFATWSQPEPVFGIRWGSMGLLLSILSIVDFTADVLRFDYWRTFSGLARFVSSVSKLVVFPIWLFWLGRLLPKAELKQYQQASSSRPSGEIGLTSIDANTLGAGTQGNPNNPFNN